MITMGNVYQLATPQAIMHSSHDNKCSSVLFFLQIFNQISARSILLFSSASHCEAVFIFHSYSNILVTFHKSRCCLSGRILVFIIQQAAGVFANCRYSVGRRAAVQSAGFAAAVSFLATFEPLIMARSATVTEPVF